MSEFELLSCPFCGDAPEVRGDHPHIVCKNVRCKLICFTDSELPFDEQVETWNRRTTNVPEVIECEGALQTTPTPKKVTIIALLVFLKQAGWFQGYDNGGHEGWVSPDREWSIAYYWLTEPDLTTAISQLADFNTCCIADMIADINKRV